MSVVLAPATTFSVYALQAHLRGSESLDTVKAFTSLALIALVSHPASRLLCAVPNVASSLGCFLRIQEFLLAHSPTDQMNWGHDLPKAIQSTIPNSERTGQSANEILSSTVFESDAIVIKNADISPFLDSPVVLQGVNLKIPKATITMVTGPVASGKSVLLKSIIGEADCRSGDIRVTAGSIGYCSQTPWIIHGTIKDIICCSSESTFIDEEWYEAVIEACDLNSDILALPDGDRTVVGSRGSTLSGGQKQRVAVARALYSRPHLFVLDDILSALDKATENSVFDRLFGANGLLKKMGSTVILATQNSEYWLCDSKVLFVHSDNFKEGHMRSADQIIILSATDDIIKQGTYDELETDGSIRPEEWDYNVSLLQVDHEPSEDKKEEIEVDVFEELEAELSEEAKDLSRQPGDVAVYKYYLKAVGSWKLLVFLFFVLVNVGSSSFSTIWLKWWAEAGGSHAWLYIGVYFILGFAYCLGNGGFAWYGVDSLLSGLLANLSRAIAVVIGPSTGRSLHNVLLNIVMR
jgi:ATP-binding cassette subfamily C (CFTR/MRP) protein 1